MQVEWLLNDQPIEKVLAPDTYIISQKDNIYAFVIPKCIPQNQGIYTIAVPDTIIKSKAILNVDGNLIY